MAHAGQSRHKARSRLKLSQVCEPKSNSKDAETGLQQPPNTGNPDSTPHPLANLRTSIGCGMEVTPISASAVAELIMSSIGTRRTLWVANYNLHAVNLYLKNREFRSAYQQADLHIADGYPIYRLARRRLVKPGTDATNIGRTGSTDWLDTLLQMNQSITICAIGATPATSRKCGIAIAKNNPNVHWIAFDGYDFKSTGEWLNGAEQTTGPHPPLDLDRSVTSADLVLVAMGMPKQERWIVDNSSLLEGKVVANVGGCLDYYAGTQKLAPRWLGGVGLEWVYRLVHSRGRLAKRYLLEPIDTLRVIAAIKFFTKGNRGTSIDS